MSQRKRIRVTCYGPIAVDPSYESPWDDLWLRWKLRPGSAQTAFVTVSALAHLDCDIRITQDCLDEAVRRKIPKLTDDFSLYLAAEKGIHAQLTGPESIVIDDSSKDSVPDLYLGKHLLTRVDAERALAYWLERAHGIKNPKFDWKQPHFIVTPV